MVIAFFAAKLFGYSLAAWLLQRSYKKYSPNFLLIGSLRVGVGILFGAAYGFRIDQYKSMLLFWAAFIPLQMLAWAIIIYLFFDRGRSMLVKDSLAVLLCTSLSIVLNAPLIAFTIGGVC